MKKQVLFLLLLFPLFSPILQGDLPVDQMAARPLEELHTINFKEVEITELIRFVSKISSVNFIFNEKELQFRVSLSSGKAVSSSQLVKALVQLLNSHGFNVVKEEGYLVIHRGPKEAQLALETKELPLLPPPAEMEFLVHKLQYHEGGEMQDTIRKMADDLGRNPATPSGYLETLRSVQWVKSTNSFVVSGDKESLDKVKKFIETLDVPLKQVFIEILVIETDARKASEFGLQWAAKGKYKEGVGMGVGNFPSYGESQGGFSSAFKASGASFIPDIPLGKGFDAGVIGDIIFHKGRSFLSLGSLVSALETDGDSSIVLNQKIITQDSKQSTIFVGDNVPFTGSVVQTIGASEQRTANIEYRDIGVMLTITPRLGEGDVITLDLQEEISEIVPYHPSRYEKEISGIQTTKTNMVTHAHIPDKHFFILSGMIRNTRLNHKDGIPCLGAIPGIGALFSKKTKDESKKNIIIFVRPRIIRSTQDYQEVTEDQESLHEGEVEDKESFNAGLSLVK